ncbi:hypothetical protein O1611_g3181 [Lasiodiplodia mahajangana]|uniref:Uncharacterized protein n=1 Tax=Lasiodiplodia mahajangana TaxID=1108764 RepID=A0ACC2JSI2_9PEZI|nr:hypothetical protein O1611_g3181 [Lasiodiplodia mahajangana]
MRVASFFTTIALGYVVQGRTLNLVGRDDNTWGLGQTDLGTTNLCDTSTFKPETSSELPLAEDCEKLVDNLSSHKTHLWFFYNSGKGKPVDDGSYWSFSQVGTCAFAAKVSDDGTAHTAISWGDAANIVRDSIHNHSTNGGKQVRTSGSMQCAATTDKCGICLKWDPSKTGKRTISWQVYKPGDNSVKISETATAF